jgi:hypothetical protein
MASEPYKYRIKLSGKEKQRLRQAKRQGHISARLMTRILIILFADAGKTIAATAELLDCCEQTVLNQRKRFLERRAEGPVKALQDLPRSGRPVVHNAEKCAHTVALVCEILHKKDKPLSRFSTTDLHQLVIREEGLADLSYGSFARILAQHALKPWRFRYWLFPRDPDFLAKASVILDLYGGFWDGQPLGPHDYVLSADEKSIQVLKRLHPSLPPIPDYEQRVESDYERKGTLAYHAAWDVFRGRIFGRVAPNTCIATFNELVHLVMEQAPYQQADRVFWVVDGGCAHHRSTFPARLQGLYPNAVAVHLPVHSSWLNQIELYFSIVQRKVLTPMDVADRATLSQRLLDFQDYYQERAKPFNWKFTAADLKKRLDTLRDFVPAPTVP